MLAAPPLRAEQPNVTTRYDIELAATADASQIAELSREIVEHGLPWRWTQQRVLACIRDRDTNAVVVRALDRIVGFAIMKYGEDEAALLLFGVHSAYRRQRVGSDLLEWLELTARSAGLRAIRLEARHDNEVANAFYRHHGYEEIGVVHGYYQGLEDAVRFLKRL